MAVNLLPSHVPIGYVNNDINQPIYASPELTRALTTMMQQIGGQSTAGPGDVTNLAAVGIEHGIRISGTLPTPTPDDLEVWVSADNIIAHAIMQTHGLLSSWDWIGLTSADGVKYIWVRTVFKSGKKGKFVGPVSAEAGINAVPGNITGLAATPIIGGIRVSGTLPADLDLAEVELFTNTVNNVNTATLQTHGLAASIDVLNLLPSDGTRYFWARCVNTSGARGAFTTEVHAVAGTADWGTQVTGAGKPANNADVTATVLADAATSITMASTTLLKYTSGSAGIFFGAGGLFGKDSGGNVTFSIVGNTGAATFKGDITGGSNINITGTGQFEGSTTASGANWAGVFNSSTGVQGGLQAFAAVGGIAISGVAASTGVAVNGTTASGLAANFVASGVAGVGVTAKNTGGGTALDVQGKLKLDNSTYTWNGYAYAAPAGSSTTVMHNDGVWRDPVTTARVNAAFGAAASAFARDGTGAGFTLNGTQVPGTGVATFAGGAKPGGSTSNVWISVVIGGVTYYIPVWG